MRVKEDEGSREAREQEALDVVNIALKDAGVETLTSPYKYYAPMNMLVFWGEGNRKYHVTVKEMSDGEKMSDGAK